MPNEKHLPESKVERDIFNQWYSLAKNQKLIMASSKGEHGQLYVYTLEAIPVLFKQMLAEYPQEKLKLYL